MKEVILFDICDTLFRANTTFDFLGFHYSKNKKYIILIKIRKTKIYKIINKILYKLFNFDLTRFIFLKFLKGKNKEELKIMMNKYYHKELKNKNISEVFELMNKFKKSGKEIILISASCDFIVSYISEKLDINRFYSTELNYEGLVCLGSIKKDILKIKHEIILSEYKNNKIIVITDNIQDIELVKMSSCSYIVLNKKNKVFWLKVLKEKIGEKIKIISKEGD